MPLPVFLVHYDAPDWVAASARSILASDIDLAVTVVDNSGNAPDADDVRVLQTGGNLGFTGAANLGLREWLAGDEEFCVIGSHDLHVDPAALRLMVESMAADPRLGIAGPVLDHGGAMPKPASGVDHVDWVSGTCMVLRRSCIERIGGFDERYRSYAEDFDLCSRARHAGWGVVVVGSATAHGLGTRHGGQGARRLANSVLFDRKRYGLAHAVRTLGSVAMMAPRAVVRGRLAEASVAVVATGLGVRHLAAYRRYAGGAGHREQGSSV